MKLIHAHQIAKNTHGEGRNRFGGVSFRDAVVQAGGDARNGHDEHEIEEQLERCGSAVRLAAGARTHRHVLPVVLCSLICSRASPAGRDREPQPRARDDGGSR